MRVLTNPTPAILARVRSYIRKNGRVEPIKLADGRWAVPDTVLTAYPQFADEILARTTFVPDRDVEIDNGWPPQTFEPLPLPEPQPPPVRPEGKRK